MIIEYNSNVDLNGEALLFFYASWSSKCNLHQDSLNRVNYDYENLEIIKINTSKFPSLKQKYNIHKIPSYVYITNGNILGKIEGYADRYTLIRWVRKHKE